MNPITLTTDRLVLRPVRMEDAEPMFLNWANDPEVTKYMTWEPHENIEVTKQVINYWLKKYEEPDTVRFAITLKGSDEPFGTIDIVEFIDDTPVIGYCLSRKLWNKGYMTEACKAVIKYVFSLGYKRIIIEAVDENIGSNRVIQKCGFKLVEKRNEKFKGQIVTINQYEINRF